MISFPDQEDQEVILKMDPKLILSLRGKDQISCKVYLV